MRASKELLAIVFSSLLSVAAAAPSASSSSSANDTKPDYPEAPDFSNDEIQPYPSLKNSDGSYIDIANLRGVRLFGFKGCGTGEGNDITQAYNDFYTLSNQPGYNAIDWDSPAATDFFGPSAGQWRLSDDRRAEIQRELTLQYSARFTRPMEPATLTSSAFPRNLQRGSTSLQLPVGNTVPSVLVATALDRSPLQRRYPGPQEH